MSELRKAMRMALERLESHEYWMDGEAIKALRQALAQPEQKIMDCVYPKCETAGGCNGPCSKPLYTAPVDAVNMSQERVDETVKREHEPVAWLEEVFNDDNKSLGHLAHEQPFENTTPVYTAPPKREWVGLPDEKEIIEMSKDAWGRALLNYGRDDHCSFYVAFARAIETYLKEKNT